jgi:hypothetical protein
MGGGNEKRAGKYGRGNMRVDAHPAWDRTHRHVAFNAFPGGTRVVLVAGLSAVVQGRG